MLRGRLRIQPVCDDSMRNRSRYAPDAQVKRIANLAKEIGISPAGLKLGADGSIEIVDLHSLGSLKSGAEENADDVIRAWEEGGGAARRT